MYVKELPVQTSNNTALQVKLFVFYTLENIEQEVNEWIRRHQVQVHHITQSQCEKQGKFVFVLSLFYASLQ